MESKYQLDLKQSLTNEGFKDPLFIFTDNLAAHYKTAIIKCF